MIFRQTKTKNFVAFFKRGGGREQKQIHPLTCIVGSQIKKILGKSLKGTKVLLSKYAFEQIFHNLSQENGACYTSCLVLA